MRSQPDLRSASYMGHDLGGGYHESFAIRTLRAQFQAEPPAVQALTLARVRRTVAERPQSYLARVWRRVYVTKGTDDGTY